MTSTVMVPTAPKAKRPEDGHNRLVVHRSLSPSEDFCPYSPIKITLMATTALTPQESFKGNENIFERRSVPFAESIGNVAPSSSSNKLMHGTSRKESTIPFEDSLLLSDASLPEQECVFITDEQLSGNWTFVIDGCTSQVFQCIYGGTIVLVKSFDVYTSLENKGALQEFEFECQTLASGKHPNISRALARSQPGTLTIGFGTKTQYIVMEHCLSMGTLASLLEEGTLNYPFVRLLSLAKDLASALCYMHHELNQDGAVIHGDLNPDCIGICKEGHMKLADMGRCKLLRKDGKSLPLVFPNQSTSSCLTRGIPSRCYAAPEIWSGGDITEKVDVYSFGVICWSMVQNREPNPCNIDPKRPGHIDTGTLDVESNWPCEFKNMLLACFRTDSSKRPTFKKILSALDKMLQTGVEKTCTSSSSSHQISQKSSGKVCTSVNGSNVSNVSNISNVSSSSVENESIADSKLTLVSTTNTDTNNSHSHQGGKRKSKLSFKDKYIMPLVNRFSAAMSTHSSRDSLSESTEHHRGGSVGNGIVQPQQDSMTKKEEFAEYIPFEASVSGRGSSFVRTVSPSPMVVVAASVSSQIVPRSTRDKISDSILSVLTTGSSSAAHRSNESGGHNIDNSSSSNNSLRRSQRYDAFCCTENVGMRSGPSLLNLQVHSFGSAGTSRPLNVSRNGSQSTLHPTSVNAQSNNNILRTKNKAAPNLNNDDEHLLSFAESIAPGHHMDVSLLERQGIECLVVTDAELTGWTFVTDGCTSQVFQCMYGGTMVLVKSFDVYTSLENKGALQEFEFECQTLASGKHPNIARALARSQPGTSTIGFGTKSQYIVMEHCLSMGTLASLLEEGNLNYPFVRLLSLAKDLASALSYMHHELNQDGAVIHGDLNPDCIGINKEGRMKLADMGRCKLLRKDGKSLPLVFPNQSTSSCLTRGVPSRCYVAPEIWSGGDITEKVDVYSFGVICWSMLQNREPGPCHIDSKRPGCIDPSTLDLESHWPCEFNALLVACWSRDVTKRPTFKKIVSALDKFTRSTRLTPMHSPTSSMKTPRELSRGISGNSMHTSGKDGGWMPPVAAEATKHHNHNHINHNNDDLNPDLPGSPAVLNVTRKSFAEKFSKVVADVLPLFRNGHSGGLDHTATMTSRRSTPTENSPNTIDMTRKSMPLGRILGLAATKSPSNGSMSTAPMSTHTLGSMMGSSSRLSSMVDSTKDPLIGHIDKVNNGNHGIDVSHQTAKWHAEVASRNLNRSALASISSPVPFSHTPEGSSTMPNLIKGTCSLPRI